MGIVSLKQAELLHFQRVTFGKLNDQEAYYVEVTRLIQTTEAKPVLVLVKFRGRDPD